MISGKTSFSVDDDDDDVEDELALLPPLLRDFRMRSLLRLLPLFSLVEEFILPFCDPLLLRRRRRRRLVIDSVVAADVLL
jgi:hypothetical protein